LRLEEAAGDGNCICALFHLCIEEATEVILHPFKILYRPFRARWSLPFLPRVETLGYMHTPLQGEGNFILVPLEPRRGGRQPRVETLGYMHTPFQGEGNTI